MKLQDLDVRTIKYGTFLDLLNIMEMEFESDGF